MRATMARTKRSRFAPSGRNRGNMAAAMKITVSNGTPRQSSINPMQKPRTTGSEERRPSARRMPSGNRAGDGDESQDPVDHQPAPASGIDVAQPKDAAPEQHARQERKYRNEKDQPPDPAARVLAERRYSEEEEEQGNQSGSPTLLEWVGAVDEEARPGGDECPAGAIRIAGLPALAPEHRVSKRPAHERRHNEHKNGQNEER